MKTGKLEKFDFNSSVLTSYSSSNTSFGNDSFAQSRVHDIQKSSIKRPFTIAEITLGKSEEMARRGASFIFLFVMLVIVGGDKCGEQMQGLASNCAPLMQGSAPSAACCGLIRSVDLSCICPKVTPAIAASINVPKVMSIVQSCGRNVPHHTRCGSIVTP